MLFVLHSVNVYAIGAVTLVRDADGDWAGLAHDVLAPANHSHSVVNVPSNVVLSHLLVATNPNHHEQHKEHA